jgi:hypothetical protein
MFFDPAGAALLLAAEAEGADRERILCRGRWQQFPEGTAIKWDANTDQCRCDAGDFGLISSYGNSLIYEGFADQFSRTADFTAQAQIRANGKHIVSEVREPGRVGTSGLGPVGLQPAVTAPSIG